MESGERPEGYARAMKLALYYLEARMTTCHQLNAYLLRKQLPERTAACVIAELRGYGYLDDEAYARRYVETRLHRSGAYKLRQELRRKGVEEDLIEEPLASVDEEDIQRGAEKAVRSYLVGKTGTARTIKAKAYQALARRGYAPDVIARALAAAMEDWEEPEPQSGEQDEASALEEALEAARKYRRTYKEADPLKQKQKTYQALRRRGYASGIIQQVLDTLDDC